MAPHTKILMRVRGPIMLEDEQLRKKNPYHGKN